MPDYIPYKDAELEKWARNFWTRIEGLAETLGVPEEEVADLAEYASDFDAAVREQDLARKQAMAKTQQKIRTRERLVRKARAVFQRIDGHPALTNDVRAILGLNIPGAPKDEPTISSAVPGIHVEAGQGRVFVHFGTLPTNEQKNTKPSWATGVNIYRKTQDEDVFRLVAFEISSPYVEDVRGPAAEYSYFVRYRGRKAQDLSEQSAVVTIAARGVYRSEASEVASAR